MTVEPDPYEAFAAKLHIDAGDWDLFLDQIRFAVAERRVWINPAHPPKRPLPPGQVYVWMNGPGTPQWEVQGTGVVLDKHQEENDAGEGSEAAAPSQEEGEGEA